MPDDEMAFSLDWLAGAGNHHPKPALTVCDQGHLVVRENTHWQPQALSPDLRSLICRIAEHGGGQ